MKALVTGAAGFIGSSLVNRLLEDGHNVIGIDCYTPYYSLEHKKRNLKNYTDNPNFNLTEIDISKDSLDEVLAQVDYVYHQAGQPGVRSSWGTDFESYIQHNVLATQRLLESIRRFPNIRGIVAASSSSVYGDIREKFADEETLPRPISPYGVTKLAAENLCSLYGSQFGLPIVSLRYFTVFGPRQRPDMAIRRLIRSALTNDIFELSGDGTQSRDFTYIDDVIEAIVRAGVYAGSSSITNRIFNIGGGNSVSIKQIIEMIGTEVGNHPLIRYSKPALGDPQSTSSSTRLAAEVLGWTPKIDIQVGIQKTVNAMKLEDNE